MAKAYPVELRQKIIDAYYHGANLTLPKIVRKFRVSSTTACKYLRQYRETNNLLPKKYIPPTKIDTRGHGIIKKEGKRFVKEQC